MTILGRVRTYGSLVAFAHTVFALPFAASAVVLSLDVPHAPLTMWRLAAMVVTTDAAVPDTVVDEIVASDGFVNGWSVDLG